MNYLLCTTVPGLRAFATTQICFASKFQVISMYTLVQAKMKMSFKGKGAEMSVHENN